jgi:Macrocin-O-methyltransferase (TylF)
VRQRKSHVMSERPRKSEGVLHRSLPDAVRSSDLEYQVRHPRTFSTRMAMLEDGLQRRTKGGLVLEFGVYKADTLNLIASLAPEAKIFGFDSFQGLPEDWRPGFKKGMFSTSPPLVPKNVTLIIGLFEKTIPEFFRTHADPISFIHIDCDLYSSTRTVLQHCNLGIGKGTIIIFDEYFNYPGWESHEYRAFSEFVEEADRSFEYLSIVPNGEQIGVIITR